MRTASPAERLQHQPVKDPLTETGVTGLKVRLNQQNVRERSSWKFWGLEWTQLQRVPWAPVLTPRQRTVSQTDYRKTRLRRFSGTGASVGKGGLLLFEVFKMKLQLNGRFTDVWHEGRFTRHREHYPKQMMSSGIVVNVGYGCFGAWPILGITNQDPSTLAAWVLTILDIIHLFLVLQLHGCPVLHHFKVNQYQEIRLAGQFADAQRIKEWIKESIPLIEIQ